MSKEKKSNLMLWLIEKEKFDPSLPTAFKMASLFKTSIEDIFKFPS